MKKNISGTAQAPPKSRFWGQTKAEMGCFSQKGLCYFGPSGAVQTVSSKRAVGHYFW